MRLLAPRLPRDPSGTAIPVFLIALPFGVLGVYLPLYGRELGASAFQVGALFTAWGLAGVLGRPLVGLAVDRFGRRPFILAGTAGYAVSALLAAVSVSLPLLFASRVAQGVGSALFWVATYALLADLGEGGARGRLFGRLVAATNSGSILGTVIGFGTIAVLGILVGWRVVFAGATVGGVLALLLLFRWVPRGVHCSTAPVPRPTTSVRFLSLLGIWALIAASYSMLAPIVLLYLRDRFNTTELMLGVAFAPAAVVYGLAPSRLARLGDRYSRRAIISVALLSSGATSLLFPLAPHLVLMTLVWVLEALFASAAIPAQNAVVSEVSGGEVRGRAYGLYAGATGLGAALGPLAGGWLYDNIGHDAPFLLNALVLWAASALLFWRLPRSSHREGVRPHAGVDPRE